MPEKDQRMFWETEYCAQPIVTFDNVVVRCYPDQFDHIFYESSSRPVKDKVGIRVVDKRRQRLC